jgi:hypothetical protein
MADEIRVSCSLSASKGGASMNTVGSTGSASFVDDMAGADMGSWTQAVGTSDEALDIPPDIGTCKYLFIANLDSTNYVELSYASGGSFVARVRIDPGGVALFRPVSTTIYVQANTAACNIFCGAVEV